ncbi:MAG: TIM barrel protein, partial [bacterium]|nr:TIM barrel protein [bacterium]
MKPPFSLSAHLFASEAATRAHLESVAQAGFKQVELWAMIPHMDYGDGRRVREVGSWLDELGLRPVSFHAPFYAHLEEARAGRWLSLAHPDEIVRAETLRRVETALRAMTEIGAKVAVIHPAAPGRAEIA